MTTRLYSVGTWKESLMPEIFGSAPTTSMFTMDELLSEGSMWEGVVAEDQTN